MNTFELTAQADPACLTGDGESLSLPAGHAGKVCPGYCHEGWLAYCTGGREAARVYRQSCVQMCGVG
jgi:hypothetical protein